jgi:hypothetical protein
MKRLSKVVRHGLGLATVLLVAVGCVDTPPPLPRASGNLPVPEPRSGGAEESDELTFIEIHGKKWDGKSDLSSRRFEVVDRAD